MTGQRNARRTGHASSDSRVATTVERDLKKEDEISESVAVPVQEVFLGPPFQHHEVDEKQKGRLAQIVRVLLPTLGMLHFAEHDIEAICPSPMIEIDRREHVGKI